MADAPTSRTAHFKDGADTGPQTRPHVPGIGAGVVVRGGPELSPDDEEAYKREKADTAD